MNTKLFSDKAPAAIGPYSQGIEANGYIFISGQLPVNSATSKLGDGIREQTKFCLENIRSVLESSGLTMASVVKTTVFMTDLESFGPMNEIYGAFFQEPFPARSTIQVVALPKGASIEIECIARR
jgi:2-iminobutanoate/2-iminopropanoate deaminase